MERDRKQMHPCQIWGVLNVTPDSFSDGGLFEDPTKALRRAEQMISEGADIVDIGGQSTRPASAAYGHGFSKVSEQQELERIVPALKLIAAQGIKTSVDTTSPAVAKAAADLGASVINDVSGHPSEELMQVVVDHGLDYVLMHNRDRGQRHGEAVQYDDPVSQVVHELDQQLHRCIEFGMPRDKIWVDPGIGFAKTAEQSLQLLTGIPALRELGCRVLIGASRKSFISEIVDDQSAPSERIGGSIATAVWAQQAQADALRVHDVAASRQAIRLIEAMVNQQTQRRDTIPIKKSAIAAQSERQSVEPT